MFEDEASFGRINTPRYCWCEKGIRPRVPCLRIREYMHVYGAVDPMSGESCFFIFPKENMECMEYFLEHLSNQYSEDKIILVCDGAPWHTAKELCVPENIDLIFIPPYTPEMNPIEQIWREVRTQGFKNEFFSSLDAVVDRLCDTLNGLSKDTVIGITQRDWILQCFN